jgi:flagellar M-ring protein FliF
MAGINKALQQMSRLWQELSAKQRFLLVGGAGLTLAVLLLLVRQAATPTYKVLFSGLNPGDAQAMGAQLAAKNIPHEIDPAGTAISVPPEQIDAARLEVASTGMPHSGRLGFEIFDKVSWGQTEFDEKVNYQRALEGELERTIQELRDVETARVHLVLPSDSVFLDRQRSAKASVILKLRRGTLSPEARGSIARLVAGAVDELNPDQVAVIDADTNQPLSAPRSGPAGDRGMDEQLTQRLLATLVPIVGPDRIRASVNVEYDPSTLEESQERYDPAATVTLSMQRTEERMGGTGVGGAVGTASNVPVAGVGSKPQGNIDDPSQNSKSESATYGVNKIVRRTSEPAGRIRRITAALVLDDMVENKQENGKATTVRRKWTPEELKQIQELAQASLGVDTARGDLVSVQNIPFDVPAPQVLPSPSRLERVRTTLMGWSGLLRYAVILLLFLVAYQLVLRPIKQQTIATMKELPAHSRRAVPAVVGGSFDPMLQGEGATPLGDASQKAKLLKQQVLEKVKREPAPSSRLVQAWLREE